MLIRPHKNGLHIGLHPKLRNALKLCFVRNLAVDNAMARIRAGRFGLQARNRVEQHLDRAVADRMRGDGEAGRMGNAGQLVQAFFRKQRDPLCGRIVCIRLAHIGSAGAERTVQKQLMFAQPVMAVRFPVKTAVRKELFELLGLSETALLHDAHGKLSGFRQPAVSAVNGLVVAGIPKIIRMHTGDAVF